MVTKDGIEMETEFTSLCQWGTTFGKINRVLDRELLTRVKSGATKINVEIEITKHTEVGFIGFYGSQYESLVKIRITSACTRIATAAVDEDTAPTK